MSKHGRILAQTRDGKVFWLTFEAGVAEISAQLMRKIGGFDRDIVGVQPLGC